MKTLILVESTHHGNTRKLVDAIAAKYDVDLADVTEKKSIDFAGYDLIGFASGIAFSKFYKDITSYAEKVPSGKKVFFLYTCGSNSRDYSKGIRQIAENQGAISLGTYGCIGYDTFGPFKLIGGIRRNHPNQEEIQGAVSFYEKILKQI